MSVHVIDAVLRHSQTEYADRLVMIVLADAAHNDGITWLSQDEVARLARVSVREVRRSIRQAEELGELETRKAQRGRRRINVYRVTVGSIAAAEPDYDRLPFALTVPFSRPDELAGRHDGDDRNRESARHELDDRTNATVTTGHLTRARDSEPSEEPSQSLEKKPLETARTDDDRRKRAAELEGAVRAVWDAVATHVEPAPVFPERRREYARLVRSLVIDADASPDEVIRRAAAYRKHKTFAGCALTLAALRKWWHLFDADLTALDFYAATERLVRNVAHAWADDDVRDELRARYRERKITREQAIELLDLSREIRAERVGSPQEADPLEDFAVPALRRVDAA